MLQKVHIENFRCLRNVTVPLRPLTILIGPNDSGKSAFLGALEFLTQSRKANVFDHWRGDKSVKVSVSAKVKSARITRDGKGRLVVEPAGENPLEPVGIFELPATGVPMESAGYRDEGAPPDLGWDGGKIPTLLDHLLRRDRARFGQWVRSMRELVDGFEEIEIGTPEPTRRRVEFVIEKGFRIPADNASVGVRLLIFFVGLAYHPSPPKLILLEEPENGVHPKRLADVVRLLREITQGVHGDHTAQVVLTTHSPHLLDYVDIENDQVLVFRRNDDGSRTAEPADAERLKNFLDEFMLGEVWYNEGEAGLVGRDK